MRRAIRITVANNFIARQRRAAARFDHRISRGVTYFRFAVASRESEIPRDDSLEVFAGTFGRERWNPFD